MKNKHFYGWKVCLGCALLLFCTSGLSINAFNVYQPYLISENGFTNTQSSFIITTRSLAAFIAMFITGFYYKLFPLRTGMFIAGLMTTSSLAIFGIAKNYPVYLIASVLMGFGYGLGTMIPIQMVLHKWFISKRSLAIGLCSSITGLSTFGIPTLLTFLIETKGLGKTFLIEATTVGIIIFTSFILIRNNPQELGLSPLTDNTQTPKEKQKQVQKVFLRKHDWYILFIIMILVGAQTNVGYSHLSVLMKSEGFDSYTIATAIMLAGLSMTISKIVFGILSQYISIEKRNTIFGSLMIAGFTMLLIAQGSKLILFSACIIQGFGFALTTVGKAEWEGDFSSDQDYGKTVRLFNIGYSAGGLIFSTLPGYLADKFNGSYIPAFVFFTFCSLAIVFTIQLFYKIRKQDPQSIA